MAIPVLYNRAATGFAEIVQRNPRGALADTIVMIVTSVAASVLACVAIYKAQRGEAIPEEVKFFAGFCLGFSVPMAITKIVQIVIVAKDLGA